jgi:chemotaxis protein methyltransferase CheR
MTLASAEFDYVRKLVHEQSAIVLEDGKGYLVESRLSPIARKAGLGSLSELVARLQSTRDGALQREVVEAMTTNETTFFRDRHPFDALRDVLLPELLASRAKERRLTIWSAASSTGQEPYSIAMLLREHFPELLNWNVRILATDLNEEVLAKARAGQYGQVEINRGLAAPMLMKYFTRDGLKWIISGDLRRMVDFQQMNLAARWPAMPPMDVIFLRNVLIYFDAPTKKKILANARQLLRPDGVLFLGGAETTINLDDAFERMPHEKAAVYRLRKR